MKLSTYDKKHGFALISTLSIMSLLVMLVIGMMSLATTETKLADATKYEMEAKANARMALMIALGELQEAVGPDQRITANAAILDDTPEDEAIDNVAEPHVMGVWKSWDKWLNEDYGDADNGIDATYAKGRGQKQFEKWLVSHTSESQQESLGAMQGNAFFDVGGETVDLVSAYGSHSAVKAGVIEVQDKGEYAWWVGDEGVKGKISPQSITGAVMTDIQAHEARNVGATRMAAEKVIDDFPYDDKAFSEKLLSNSSLEIDARTQSGSEKHGYFHELSTVSKGLLTDVRRGGLKWDLNLALEKASLPAEMGTSPRAFSDDLSALATSQSQGLTRWDIFKDFHLMGLSSGQTGGVLWDANTKKPYLDYRAPGAEPQKGTFQLMPIMARYQTIISTKWDHPNLKGGGGKDQTKRAYKAVISPVITLWNPYNVEIKVSPIQINTGYTNLEMNLVEGSNKGKWDHNWFHSVKPVRFTEAGTKAQWSSNEKIVFRPGEVRIFSVDSTSQDNAKGGERYAAAGYDPNHEGVEVSLGTIEASVPIGNVGVGLSFGLEENFRSSNDAVDQVFFNYATKDKKGNWKSIIGINHVKSRVDIASKDEDNLLTFPATEGEQSESQAVYNMQLKTADLIDEELDYYPDNRLKAWAYSAPDTLRSVVPSPDGAFMVMSNYDVYATRVRGALNSHLPDVVIDGDKPDPRGRSFYGAGFKSDTGVSQVLYKEFPLLPLSSIAQFQGVSQIRDTADAYDTSSIATPFAVGNSFSHPMVTSTSVHTFHDWGAKEAGEAGLAVQDYWDVPFLFNDGLWDKYWFSSVYTQKEEIYGLFKAQADVLKDFLSKNDEIPNKSLQLNGNREASQISDPTDDFKRLASVLYNEKQFNVNSTSKDAWKALFGGARDTAIKLSDENSNFTKEYSEVADKLVVSRFTVPFSEEEGADAFDEKAWTGVRYITDAQLDKLAEEMVRQVKLRGPFLNMSDFINRRLSSDELARCGALQAAIDWDEFNGNSPSASDATSINARFKDQMVEKEAIEKIGYVYPEAAEGSLLTGIPGYVTQADLLNNIGNSIAVRSDTFRIRAYGGAKDSTGKVRAKAWCEAVVQRLTEYVERDENTDGAAGGNAPWEFSGEQPNGVSLNELSATNKKSGRKLEIVSFRWLSPSEL
jgi:hypothetical protein